MNDLKLTTLNKAEISKSKMKNLNGGYRFCGCSCWARNSGGASIDANKEANYYGGIDGLVSDRGTLKKMKDDGNGIKTEVIN